MTEKSAEAKAEAKAEAHDHAEGIGLKVGRRYAFRAVNAAVFVHGRLVSSSDLGAVVQLDEMAHPSFIPWCNIFAVDPL